MILVRINIWNIDFFDYREIIHMSCKVVDNLLFSVTFCWLRSCFWMFAKWRSEFIWLIDVHIGCNINLILGEDWRIWELILNMMNVLCQRSLHLDFRNVFIVGLILRYHWRLLDKYLSCGFNSLVTWNRFLRRDYFRSFWNLDDVLCLWNNSLGIVVPWFLYDFYLLVLYRLVGRLFTWECLNSFWECSRGQIDFFI